MQKLDVNFFRGHPSDSLLPSKVVLKGAERLLSPQSRPGDDNDEIRHPLTYGSDPGSLEVRQLIADWSHRAHHEDQYGPIDPDAINLTNGASFGAQTALQQATLAHTGYTRRAFIITPTYFLINSIFLDAGFNDRLTAIPELTPGALDLDYLETQFKKYHTATAARDDDSDEVHRVLGDAERKVYRYVVYCVPTFSNPTGSTMTLDTRKRLIKLARQYDALIICDDVYDLLDHRSEKNEYLPRLVTLDRTMEGTTRHGNVVSNCTFSKLLGPGIRVGWQETATPLLAQQFARGGAIRSGGTPSHMNTMIVGELLKGGEVQETIDSLVKVYGERSAAMRTAMESYLPNGTLIQGGEGGYFFWVTLPAGYDTDEIERQCAHHGVVLAHERNFLVVGDEIKSGRCFRVSLSYESIDNAVAGIKLWGQVCELSKRQKLRE